MMKDDLKTAMKEAMKAKEKVRLDTIRSLLSAIQYEEMQKGVEDLADDAVIGVLQREQKKRVEEMEFAEKANRNDLKEKLHIELSCIEGFLPKQLSAEELEKIVVDLKASNPSINMGMIMKSLQEKYAGQYNGKLASEVVRKALA